MDEMYTRTALLVGESALLRLQNARVAVFGLGGVGAAACEALARGGVGKLDLVDHDTVSHSNRNRQILALTSTVGRKKIDVMRERLLDIQPRLEVRGYDCFFLPETADAFDFTQYDYVVDAIDTVTAKVELAVRCQQAGVPLIAAMGTGNKLHPEQFVLADIYETSVCPLARVMRGALRKRGVKQLRVVYSQEPPVQVQTVAENGRHPAGSTAFCPPAAGYILAGAVLRDLMGIEN